VTGGTHPAVRGTINTAVVIGTVTAVLTGRVTTSPPAQGTAVDLLILTETLTTALTVTHAVTVVAVTLGKESIHVKEKKNLQCVRLRSATFTRDRYPKLLSLASLFALRTTSASS